MSPLPGGRLLNFLLMLMNRRRAAAVFHWLGVIDRYSALAASYDNTKCPTGWQRS